jgi:hypothetical protein
MSVLRRAYVEVLPDTKGFDPALTEQLKRTDPGGKAGKILGKQLGGQLNRALSKLDLPAIDVKADPKTALAALDAVEHKLRGLGRDAETVEVKVQTERALSQLQRFKKQLGDIGEEQGEQAAAGFAARFGARIGPLIANVAASPPVAVGGALLGAALAPGLAAGVAGAIVGGAGIGGVIGGLKLAARDEQVKQAGEDLGAFVLGDLTRRSSAFVPATLAAIQRVKQGFIEIGPDLDRVFKSSRFVEPLVAGAVAGAKKFVAGFADAVDNADPVIDALRYGLEQLGSSAGEALHLLASDAKEGASAIDDLTVAMSNLITTTGGIIHATATVKGWTNQLDIAIDKGRFWVEDHSAIAKALKGVGIQLDLTADGFKVGTAEADAFRKVAIGTATAQDFATLKAAGLTDAQLAAADASGTYRAELERISEETRKAAVATGALVASEKDIKAAQQAATRAQQDYNRSLDLMAPAGGRAKQVADGLRKATENLYGAQIAATDANEAYEASWDSLSDSIKQNGKSLNIHTAAGRSNRDALQAVATASREMYFADIQANGGITEATKKHIARIAALKEEAKRSGLDRVETDKLVDTYGSIPKGKQTKLVVAGVDAVVQSLKDLYVFQRSLADGIPIASEIAKLKGEKGPAKRYGGYAHGGAYEGRLPGAPSPVDNLTGVGADGGVFGLAGGEFIVNARQTGRHREMLEDLNAGRGGFAAGGYYPVEQRDFRVTTNASRTRVPPRSEVQSKVMLAVPGGGRTSDWIVRAARQIVPGIQVLSKDRPGAVTLTGNRSYHALGRAVDFHWNRKLAEVWNQRYMARTKELITPWQDLNIQNGRRHAYSSLVYNQHNFAGGNPHDHIAMANGGVIREPVVGVGASGRTYSFGERGPETVTPGGGGNTYNISVAVPVGAHPAETGRQVVLAIQAFEQSNGARWRSGS